MHWQCLDKVDTNLYKGIAILLIVIHNFMHLFPKPKQNEFEFNLNRTLDFIWLLANEPENLLRGSFSFFGHFGVQIFIFLSAYGLAKKYSASELKWLPFIQDRILKIYPMFLLAIVTWLLITGWFIGGHGFFGPIKILYWNVENLLYKLLLISNFIPGNALKVVGPWWFIPFIFQFYFAFPILHRLYNKFGEKILLVIAIMSIALTILLQGKIGNLNIYFTILGHLPEFCLGMYLAQKQSDGIKIPTILIFATLLIFLAGNINKSFWYVNHISFLVLALSVFSLLIPKIHARAHLRKFLMFFGYLSMPLFLVNGFLREPFISWAKDYNHWLLTLIFCLLFVFVSAAVAWGLLKVEQFLSKKRRVSLV